MLIKDPLKRPSMRKILEKEFLSRRISKLLTTTITKNEFSSTFVTKHLTPHTSEGLTENSVEEVVQKDDQVPLVDDMDGSQADAISKQKIVISKDAGLKRKNKIQVMGAQSTGEEQSELVWVTTLVSAAKN